MDIRAQEASGGGHLLEGVGEIMGPLVVIVGVCVLKYAHLVNQTSSESFPRASQWFSLRNLTRGFPSFHLWQSCSSGVMSNPIVSSSSGLGMAASWSGEWCCHLILVGGGISDTVGGEAVDVSSLPAVASCRVVAGHPQDGSQ